MNSKGVFLMFLCATFLSASSATYRFWKTKYGRWPRPEYKRRRMRRTAELDTRFLDAAMKAFTSLAAEEGIVMNDKFKLAINKIEKTLATVQADGSKYRYNGRKANRMWKIMYRAAKSGNVEAFRQALGRAMFANLTVEAKRRKNKLSGSAAESSMLMNGAKVFLKSIKQQIGEDNFAELVSINGEVTLVFVIDTTGSMSDDIEGAKAIAEQIIKYEREVPVNFILSRFNDPEVEPVIFRDKYNLTLAIQDISAIRANGGGDCPEMTFEGMLQALYSSPMPGSAMYVFTDASPKDATVENIETVKALAIDMGIPIYFFAKESCTNELDTFRSVAQDTGGFMFHLQSDNKIKRLSSFVKENMRGGVIVDARKTADQKAQKRYSIPVDDSIEKLILTVSLSKPSKNVKFVSPSNVEENPTNEFDFNVMFQVGNPAPGDWTLIVPHDAGAHEYRVQTFSRLNIDFSHYYFKYMPRNLAVHNPVAHPLQGAKATMVMIKISEMKKVDRNSLQLKVIYKNGTDGGNFRLHKVGDSGMRFRARLKLHPGLYKLQLSGKTKRGHSFTRLSSNFDEAKPFRLGLVWAREYTLPVGKRSHLLMKVENPSYESNFTFNATDSFGYASYTEPQGDRLSRSRFSKNVYFKLKFDVPQNATAHINKANRVVIKAIGASGATSTLVTYLLITGR